MSLGHKHTSPKWCEVETSGRPPIKRFHHGFEHFKEGNMLAVFGGRRFATVQESEFVTQVCLLRLDTFEWFEVKFKSEHALNEPP